LRATNRIGALAAGLVGAAVMGLLGSCTDGTHPEYFAQRYIIEVDSVSIPAALTAGDTLEARFWGYVGPNSCHAFEGFAVDHGPHRVDLTLWTKYFRRTGSGCAQALVFLDGEPYRYGPLPPGDFTLVVHQPDGSTLEYVVPVTGSGIE
jgi:hypothetical protein